MNAIPGTPERLEETGLSPEECLARFGRNLDEKAPWIMRVRAAVGKVLGLSGSTDLPFATTLALGLNTELSRRRDGTKILALGGEDIDLGILAAMVAHPGSECTLVEDPNRPNPRLQHWLAALGLNNVHVASRAAIFGDTNLAQRAIDLVLAAGALTPGLAGSTYASDTSYLRHVFPGAQFLPDEVRVHGIAVPDRPRQLRSRTGRIHARDLGFLFNLNKGLDKGRNAAISLAPHDRVQDWRLMVRIQASFGENLLLGQEVRPDSSITQWHTVPGVIKAGSRSTLKWDPSSGEYHLDQGRDK